MKLEAHNFDDHYRRGFRLEVMPRAGIPTWVRIAKYPGTIEGAKEALAAYERVRGRIERDEALAAGVGLCRGVALWADPLVSADLEEGLDAATPSIGEAFAVLGEGISLAIELGRQRRLGGVGSPLRVKGGRSLLGLALPPGHPLALVSEELNRGMVARGKTKKKAPKKKRARK